MFHYITYEARAQDREGHNLKNIIDFIPKGRCNSISETELALRSGMKRREVRRAIFDFRCKGFPICTICNNRDGGVFIPTSADEAIESAKMLRSRIISAEKAIKAVEDYAGIGGAASE